MEELGYTSGGSFKMFPEMQAFSERICSRNTAVSKP
jgi:hypothetical protein